MILKNRLNLLKLPEKKGGREREGNERGKKQQIKSRRKTNRKELLKFLRDNKNLKNKPN